MTKKILVAFLLLSLALGSYFLSGQEKGDKKVLIQQKQELVQLILPDLVLEKIKFTTEAGPPGKTRLRIDYDTFNNSTVHSKCCPTAIGKKAWQDNPLTNLLFECIIEVRSYPNGRYKKMVSGTVVIWLEPMQKWTIYAIDTFPVGKKRQYRATVDPKNWINEKNEDNNQKTAIWPQFKLKKVIKR